MKAYKILLKEIKEENQWGYDSKENAQIGEVIYPFSFKEDWGEITHLKKGDIVYFKDDYPKKFILEGQELISINPNSLICLK